MIYRVEVWIGHGWREAFCGKDRILAIHIYTAYTIAKIASCRVMSSCNGEWAVESVDGRELVHNNTSGGW